MTTIIAAVTLGGVVLGAWQALLFWRAHGRADAQTTLLAARAAFANTSEPSAEVQARLRDLAQIVHDRQLSKHLRRVLELLQEMEREDPGGAWAFVIGAEETQADRDRWDAIARRDDAAAQGQEAVNDGIDRVARLERYLVLRR